MNIYMLFIKTAIGFINHIGTFMHSHILLNTLDAPSSGQVLAFVVPFFFLNHQHSNLIMECFLALFVCYMLENIDVYLLYNNNFAYVIDVHNSLVIIVG